MCVIRYKLEVTAQINNREFCNLLAELPKEPVKPIEEAEGKIIKTSEKKPHKIKIKLMKKKSKAHIKPWVGGGNRKTQAQ